MPIVTFTGGELCWQRVDKKMELVRRRIHASLDAISNIHPVDSFTRLELILVLSHV